MDGWSCHFPVDFGDAHHSVPRLHVGLFNVIFGTRDEGNLAVRKKTDWKEQLICFDMGRPGRFSMGITQLISKRHR
jgi:hypothetical protein